jgi:two-component system sensor histidine kinase QseC
VPCGFACNDVLVSVLVRNLIDNALRYCPASSNILITVRAHGAGVLLRVEDDGPGMAEADIARLGERFFRVTGSEEVGSGLGWSIVRRIADAHHLFITIAHSQALGGLSVTLSSGTPAVE